MMQIARQAMPVSRQGNRTPAIHTVMSALTGMLITLGTTPVCGRDVPLAAQSVIGSSAGGRAVMTADIDGDGDLDLMVPGYSGSTLQWFKNTAGTGASWTAHAIGSVSGAVACDTADLDGDGDLDAISAAQNLSSISRHFNTSGDGSTWSSGQLITGSVTGIASVAAGDIDGDGDADVVGGASTVDSITWHENTTGSGTSWTSHTITLQADGVGTVEAVDMDQDGDLDVLAASRNSDTVSWFENMNGIGSSWTERIISTSIDNPSALAVGDADRDGDLDVFSAAADTDEVVWFKNLNGAATSWSAEPIAIGLDSAGSVHLADLDQDGDLDALSTSADDDKVTWHENTAGDGSGWTNRTLSTAHDQPTGVTTGDIDGDGDADVVATSYLDNELAWFTNKTIHRSSIFPARNPIAASPDQPTIILPADVDRDGDCDAVAVTSGDNTISWIENSTGDGTAWTSHTITTAASGVSGAFASDVDDDGDLDLLSAASLDNKIAWHENTAGNGTAWTEHAVSTDTSVPQSIFAADIDGDGDVDALSASEDDDTVAWHENTADDGSTWTQRIVSTDLNGAHAVTAGDVDRDGDLDIIAASYSYNKLVWYENTAGTGTAWTEHLIATIGGWTISAEDMDSDGNLDILVTAYSDVFVLRNVFGDGSSWNGTGMPGSGNAARSAQAADVDQDGDLDVVWAAYYGNKFAWSENVNGDAQTWTSHVIAIPEFNAAYASAGDVDGDGDLDILSATDGSGLLSWFPNKGGQFSLATFNWAPAALADGTLYEMMRIRLTHEGRSGDTDVELATVELMFDDGTGAPGSTPLTSAQANALLDEIRIYRDSLWNSTFDPPVDALLATVSTLTLDAQGRMSVPLPDGAAQARVAYGAAEKVFFVAVLTTADASSQTPSQVRITHVTEASSTAQDQSSDIPLTLEFASNVSTGAVTLPAQLSGFVVE